MKIFCPSAPTRTMPSDTRSRDWTEGKWMVTNGSVWINQSPHTRNFARPNTEKVLTPPSKMPAINAIPAIIAMTFSPVFRVSQYPIKPAKRNDAAHKLRRRKRLKRDSKVWGADGMAKKRRRRWSTTNAFTAGTCSSGRLCHSRLSTTRPSLSNSHQMPSLSEIAHPATSDQLAHCSRNGDCLLTSCGVNS